MSSISRQIASDLSAAAYQNIENGSTIQGYMLVTHEHFTDGFRGQVWESISTPGNFVFAFGGTGGDNSINDIFGDLGTDIELANGTLSPQFSDALSFYNTFLQNNKVTSVNVTGHSLGGALAEFVTANGNPTGGFLGGITFEAPGIEQIALVDKVSNTSLIDYVDLNDPVATFEGFGATEGQNEHVGQTVTSFDLTINSLVQSDISAFNSFMNGGPTQDQIKGFLFAHAGLGAALFEYHLLGDVDKLLGLTQYTSSNLEATNKTYTTSPVANALKDAGLLISTEI